MLRYVLNSGAHLCAVFFHGYSLLLRDVHKKSPRCTDSMKSPTGHFLGNAQCGSLAHTLRVRSQEGSYWVAGTFLFGLGFDLCLCKLFSVTDFLNFMMI